MDPDRRVHTQRGLVAFFDDFWHDTRVNASSRNVTADVLMLGMSVAVLMVVEARKYGVRFAWLGFRHLRLRQ